MAIMIPNKLDPTTRSTGEKRVFEWFSKSEGIDKWYVFHSFRLEWVKLPELDFVVIAPPYGIICLEVKAGQVAKNDREWSFTNKDGKTDTEIRGPFKQVHDGMYAFQDMLSKRLGPGHQDIIKDHLFACGVMFPDIDEFPCDGFESQQWQIFDKRNGHDVKSFVINLAKKAQELKKASNGIKLAITNSDAKYMANLLRGDFNLSASEKIQFIQDNQITLTNNQLNILNQLKHNQRCLISGGAGTGKTFLAIEAVRKALDNNERVAFCCYNRNLADWLCSQFGNQSKDDKQSLYIDTFPRLMVHTARVGLNTIPDDDSDDFYTTELPKLAIKACQNPKVIPYDRIIIDEAQDIITRPYLNVLNFLLKGNLKDGKLDLFGDYDKQAIYNSKNKDFESLEDLLKVLTDYTSFSSFELYENYRNTKQICGDIIKLTGPLQTKWESPLSGDIVHYIGYQSIKDEKTALDETLKKLKTAGVEPSKITILSPWKRENSVIKYYQEKEIANYDLNNKTLVSFCTIYRFKGLENSVVILTDIEESTSKDLLYVGMSRARAKLIILMSEHALKKYSNQ